MAGDFGPVETSILFLLNAGQLWNLGSIPPDRLGHSPLEEADELRNLPGGEEAAAKEAEWRQKVLAGGELEAVGDRSLVDPGALAVQMFMGGLWRLSEERVVELTFGTSVEHAEEHYDVGSGWTELPIEVSLSSPPSRDWVAAEGAIIDALSGAGTSNRAEITTLARSVAEPPPRRVVDICRDAAVEKGLLRPGEQSDPGAIALGHREGDRKEAGGGFLKRFAKGLTGPTLIPIHVAANHDRVEELTEEFERQNEAYLDYRKTHAGFEGRVDAYWHAIAVGHD